MVDRYTKVVLTVIAGALVTLVVQNGTGSASAQGGAPQHVQICDLRNCSSLDAIGYSEGRMNYGLNVVQVPAVR